MAIIDGLLEELEMEAVTTRRVLERVPDEHLGWKPHPRARTLGELALHIALVPGAVSTLAAQSDVQIFPFVDRVPRSAAELLPALEESIATARRVLAPLDDAAMAGRWRLLDGERVIVDVPRQVFIRSTVLNHWYHHRGQLSTYLRALGLQVPAIYGPSADENPLG